MNDKSNGYKKSVPTGNDLAFVEACRKILAGQIVHASQLGTSCNGRWGEPAQELLVAKREDGETGFWQSWTSIANDGRPVMNDWEPLVRVAPDREPEEQPWGKYRPQTLLELASKPKPSDIIQDIIYEKTVGLLFGAAGTKKSFLAFDWFAHVAMNLPWQGHAIKKQGKCVYTLAEGADNFVKRALAWCAHHHVPLEKLSENLIIIPREIPLACASELNEYIADVARFLDKVSPVMVCFDTLMRCSGGENINAPDVMAKLYDGANFIRRELGVAHALIVHHEGKDSTKGSAGSFVLRANCDISHRLTCEPTTGMLTLSCNPSVGGKMKDKAEYPDIYLNTRPVYYSEAMTNDESSLVIESGEKPVTQVKLTANRQAVYDALPIGSALRFAEWKQAVDKARSTDSLPPMPKQTFIDNKDWLIEHGMVRKVGTDDTEQNTYMRIQEVEE